MKESGNKIVTGIVACFFIFSTSTCFNKTESEFELTVHVLTDKNLLENYLPQGESEKYLNECLLFASDYFEKQFGIKLSYSNQNIIEMDDQHHLSLKELKPQNEDITIIFKDGKGFDFGFSESSKIFNFVTMNIQLDQERQYYRKWLLIHELAHLFGAIDLTTGNSLMDDSILVDSSGDNTVAKKSEDEVILTLDDDHKEIISLYKDGIKEIDQMTYLDNLPINFVNKIYKKYEQMIKDSRYPENIKYRLGNYYLQSGRVNEAHEIFKLALEKYGDFTGMRNVKLVTPIDDIQLALALSYLKLEKYPEAIDTLEKISENAKKYNEKFYYLGLAYSSIGESDKALNSLRRSVKVQAGNKNAWYMLGIILVEQAPLDMWYGKIMNEAFDAFQQAISIDENYGEALFYLGLINIARNHPDPGKEQLNKAESLGINLSKRIKKKDGVAFLENGKVVMEYF